MGNRNKERQVQPETAYNTADQFKEAGLEMAGTTARPVKDVEKQVWEVYRSGPNTKEFTEALYSRGIAFACLTPDEAHKSYRDAQFAKAVGRVSPIFEAAAIVFVRSPG